jgi:hypothetical protein
MALALLLLLISVVLSVSFGWSAFATITERPGLNGEMYLFYDLSRIQFSLYTGIVSLSGFAFGMRTILSILKRNERELRKTLIYFLAFIIVLVICENALQLRFTGKG